MNDKILDRLKADDIISITKPLVDIPVRLSQPSVSVGLKMSSHTIQNSKLELMRFSAFYLVRIFNE